MALFKIKRGLATNLPTNSVEGYCYVTTDDKKFYIDLATATTASSATRICLNAAYADSAGSANSVAWGNITSKPTYYDAKAIKSITRSGTTFTYTCLDGTTGTFTQQDNNTTYTFTNKAATLAWNSAVTIATVGGVDITVKLPANPNTDHYAWNDITGKPSTFAPAAHTQTVATGGTGATSAAGARANLSTWALVSDSYDTLIKADGSTNGWIKIGTANTSYGLLPSQSGGAGSGHNYLGTSSWYWKYAYVDEMYGHLNGSCTGSAGSVAWGNVTGKPSTFTPASHNHNRAGVSRSWINGRDTAIIRTTSYSGYDAILSMKTTNGAWELGVYTSNILYFVYTPDTQYNAGQNSGYNNAVNIRPNGVLYGACWNDYAECRWVETI